MNACAPCVRYRTDSVPATPHSGRRAFKFNATNTAQLGVVQGLVNGQNVIAVQAGGLNTSLTLTNYPITGPIISGPWQTPYICQTASFLLPDGSFFGTPTDTNCTAAARVTYMYLPTGATALKAVSDTTKLPADIGSATTVAGVKVPFIVRVETSTVDRGIYQSAVLHDPTAEATPTPLAPPKGWNKRLIAIEGFCCPGGWYVQGGSQGNLPVGSIGGGYDFNLLSVQRLSEGYALFANTLQHASNNCNAVLASEAAMMSKEYFIKSYGVPTFTVSAGVPLRDARPHAAGQWRHQEPRDVEGEPGAGRHRMGSLHPVGGGLQGRRCGRRATREGDPQQADPGGRWMLEQRHAVHRRNADVGQRPHFAVQHAVSVADVPPSRCRWTGGRQHHEVRAQAR